jgi:hypothetical protein
MAYKGSDNVQYTSAYVHIVENYPDQRKPTPQGQPTPTACVMVFRTPDTSGSWTSPGGRYDVGAHRPDIRATARHFLAELTRGKLMIPAQELGTLQQCACVPLEGEGHARVYGLHVPAQSVNQAFFQVPPPSPPPLGTSLGIVKMSTAELPPPPPPTPHPLKSLLVPCVWTYLASEHLF